jgi:protein-S-isoprenylcysteine O-methyltransferase Ste14
MDTPESRSRVLAVFGTAVFLVLAPGTFDVLVPWWISHWRVHTPFPGFIALQIISVLLIAAGAVVVLDSFARFALQGIGTPAPVLPPQHLVVTGFYRYVRNPMYVAVVSIALDQALFFGNTSLLLYSAGAWLVTHTFVLLYEEPKLRKTFGAEYTTYCVHVPRWIPRLTPWNSGVK